MVLVPAGSFQMGSTVEEMQLGFEMCQQAVNETAECQRYWFDAEAQNGDNTQTFVQPFWIDLTEVSRGQYWACIEAGACEEIPTSDYSTEPDQPISQVTWFQAHAYCTWRGVRLPTESEWEYAARGPDRWLFPWGNQFNGALANHCDVNCGVASWGSDFDYVSEENNDGYALIAPVGSYPEGASWVGALDMSGNVWEWTHSLYRIYPYSPDDGRESTVEDSADGLRVLRGGSFNGTAFGLRATDRFVDDPDNGGTGSGFRCARSFAP
ncbi:MAG: formylglycine-generating enzyme family protein [Chloroflexi bacterium]|nr:formylglycine-generating enzyme family protein [Chloroflexota bacterium]